MERTGARRRTTFGRQESEEKLGECAVFCGKMEESVVVVVVVVSLIRANEINNKNILNNND